MFLLGCSLIIRRKLCPPNELRTLCPLETKDNGNKNRVVILAERRIGGERTERKAEKKEKQEGCNMKLKREKSK